MKLLNKKGQNYIAELAISVILMTVVTTMIMFFGGSSFNKVTLEIEEQSTEFICETNMLGIMNYESVSGRSMDEMVSRALYSQEYSDFDEMESYFNLALGEGVWHYELYEGGNIDPFYESGDLPEETEMGSACESHIPVLCEIEDECYVRFKLFQTEEFI